MDVIGTVKQLADLAKKVGQMELYQRLVDLQATVVEREAENLKLSRANHDLQVRLEGLERQLQFSKSLTFRAPFYYGDGDEVPYCPRCWESDHVAMHLVSMPWSGGTRYDCPKCNWTRLPPDRGPMSISLTR